jgi:hypothetical protein
LPLTRQWVEAYREQQLREHPCPDLQALMQRWGGYDHISLQAWNEYDQAMAEWRRAYRSPIELRALFQSYLNT